MAWYAKFDGVDGATGNWDAPSVHDIAVSKFHESESNVELVVKVLDAGTFYGATTSVELAITVTDTETGAGDPVGPFSAYGAATGSPLPSVTDIIIDPFNPLSGIHTGGVHALLGDGSVRHGAVGNDGLIYSGESGGMFAGEFGSSFTDGVFARADGNTYQGTTVIVDGVLLLGRDPPSAFDLM